VTTLLQIDAFTSRPFGGNPAAVALLTEAADATWMQQVAAEMNLAETAFVTPPEDGVHGLRWFTPTVEVDLCGHATLASAHALWSTGRVPAGQGIRFATRSGELGAEPDGDLVALDLPANPATPGEAPAGFLDALGVAAPVQVGVAPGGWVLVEVATEAEVRALTPDFRALRSSPMAVVTARADDAPFDCASRVFGPAYGIDEDPVTGSAHCILGPWWAPRLGRADVRAHQVSARGGDLHVRVDGDRVRVAGQAVTVLTGELVR
jgi:PhzF family phenazine biosynthesis protein